jgi:hypothetical protein
MKLANNLQILPVKGTRVAVAEESSQTLLTNTNLKFSISGKKYFHKKYAYQEHQKNFKTCHGYYSGPDLSVNDKKPYDNL